MRQMVAGLGGESRLLGHTTSVLGAQGLSFNGNLSLLSAALCSIHSPVYSFPRHFLNGTFEHHHHLHMSEIVQLSQVVVYSTAVLNESY
jgi:hypothetical protein